MTIDLTIARRVSSTQLLARMLEAPDLALRVQSLPAEILARVIDKVGLEDAGELVAFATTEQLAGVFDEDLWRSDRPGEDERFDAERFLVWLSVMHEAGDAFVAEKLSELPPDLVTLAFHRQMLVLDIEAMTEEMRETDEREASRVEKALSNCLSEEIDAYHLIARRHEGWDDVVAAVLALDKDHHAFLMGVLDRCCAMSNEYIDDNGGLYDVLTSEEMLESDVAGDREERRAEAGYVAPSSAAAFLKLARGSSSIAERDPMTRAYFRQLAKNPIPAPQIPPDWTGVFRDAGIIETPQHLLPAPAEAEPMLVLAMREIAGEPVFAARGEELAYLANVLAAGASFQGRRMRQVEAVRAAIATCSLGLELAAGTNPDAVVAALRTTSADVLFRLAWRRLDPAVPDPEGIRVRLAAFVTG